VVEFTIMLESLARVISGPSQPAEGLRRTPVFIGAFILVLAACFLIVGCGPRIVRVPVSDEDLIEANHLVQEGNEAYREGDFYPALIKYLAAAELNPNSEFICNRLGMAYLQLEYPEEAITAFKRSTALNSKYPYAVNNLGSAYFAAGSIKKAEKYFKKAIRMKKDEATFYLNLGTLYFEKKKPEKAYEAWRQSLSLDRDILYKNNSISVAIKGGGVSPEERDYFMARIYAAAGDVPRTIESLENALMNGFSDIERIETNPEFDPIRKDERFVKFMESAAVWAKSKQPASPSE